MLHFVQDVRAVGGMGRGISDHNDAELCKVRLVRTWIKTRVVVDGENQCRAHVGAGETVNG